MPRHEHEPNESGSAGGPPTVVDVERFKGRVSVRSLMLTLITVLAVLYTLYFARPVLMPLALAILLSLVLMPVVRAMARRLRLPHEVSAALLLLILAVFVGGLFYQLGAPAMAWLEQLPESYEEIDRKLHFIRRPVEELQEAAEKVDDATALDSEPSLEVKVQQPSSLQLVLQGAWGLVAGMCLVGAFLFFLLVSGDMFLLKLVRVIPRFEDKKRAVTIAHEIQSEVARYVFTITAINIAVGVAPGGVLFALGVPNAALWGVMAAVLNYIPYVGAIVGVLIVGVVAITTFDSVGYAMLAPASYLAITLVESNFVTPMILGKRLLLNALVLFASVIFWGWIWGVPGALIAVPITVAMRITFDRIEQLRPFAEFIGR
jgi:predicted PurR-regulated permease PerM